MKFEYILPALRAGKKVRRAKWDASDCIAETSGRFYVRPCARSRGLDAEDINAKDWEVMPEPKRVADYFCPVFGLHLIDRPYYKETHEVGKQPAGAVLVPGSEREVVE